LRGCGRIHKLPPSFACLRASCLRLGLSAEVRVGKWCLSGPCTPRPKIPAALLNDYLPPPFGVARSGKATGRRTRASARGETPALAPRRRQPSFCYRDGAPSAALPRPRAVSRRLSERGLRRGRARRPGLRARRPGLIVCSGSSAEDASFPPFSKAARVAGHPPSLTGYPLECESLGREFTPGNSSARTNGLSAV
jgi:hypothetical protein